MMSLLHLKGFLKTKRAFTLCPGHLTLGIHQQEVENYVHVTTCVLIFIVGLLIIVKSGKNQIFLQ